MLVRRRLSRIFYLRSFFDYPVSLNKNTLMNLGIFRLVRIGFSYIKACLFPIKPENNLEEFFINRFGRELYKTFFQSYTEKVWGVPCDKIGADWGAQRIKGLSITKTLVHAVKKIFRSKPSSDIRQKETETSLIEQFLYPKFGPGQMWEEVARQVREKGGVILHHQDVTRILTAGGKITGMEVTDKLTGQRTTHAGDFFLSSMPVKELISALDCAKPANVVEVSEGLLYRDFITVGLLLKKFKAASDPDKTAKLIRDCWIYVQEPDVLVGRIQIFNNWSPYMVRDPETVWIGMEYFCREGDELWTMTDADLQRLGVAEMQRLRLAAPEDHLDGVVIRMPKAYPGYYGSYARFGELRAYLDGFANLFLVGRNGMHRYNNQDHSMLSAKKAVEAILAGSADKSAIWAVNIDDEYHEEGAKS